MSTPAGEGDEDVAADIEVLSGNPDALELAAITAVLAGVLEELAQEQGRRRQSGQSAWERSQRAMREPLTPGPGVWRTFNG